MLTTIIKKFFKPRETTGVLFSTRTPEVTESNSNFFSHIAAKRNSSLSSTEKKLSTISPYSVVKKKVEISSVVATRQSADNSSTAFAQNYHPSDDNVCPLKVRDMLSRMATIRDCIRRGIPGEHWLPLSQLDGTINGDVIKWLEYIGATTSLFEGIKSVNYQRVFGDENLFTLPQSLKNTLLNVSPKKNAMYPYEVYAQAVVNRDFAHNRLGFAYDRHMRHEHDLSTWANYFNQTRNNHPDYVLLLDAPVEVNGQMKNLIAYDLKFGQLQPPVNIVKACTTDAQLGTQLALAHRELISYLERLSSKLTIGENAIAKNLIRELKLNVGVFALNNNLSTFRTTYHSLHEKFYPFLLRNGIGFNMLVKISSADFDIPNSSRSFFSEQYKTYMSKGNTVVSSFAERIAKNNSHHEMHVIIHDFYKELINRS